MKKEHNHRALNVQHQVLKGALRLTREEAYGLMQGLRVHTSLMEVLTALMHIKIYMFTVETKLTVKVTSMPELRSSPFSKRVLLISSNLFSN